MVPPGMPRMMPPLESRASSSRFPEWVRPPGFPKFMPYSEKVVERARENVAKAKALSMRDDVEVRAPREDEVMMRRSMRRDESSPDSSKSS
eukprot:9137950-Karenia_brevis.AAC.1